MNVIGIVWKKEEGELSLMASNLGLQLAYFPNDKSQLFKIIKNKDTKDLLLLNKINRAAQIINDYGH